MSGMKKIFPVLAAINLLATLALIIYLIAGPSFTNSTFPESSSTVSYTLYIGLNDKDTYTQTITNEDARAIVDDICLKYVDGFTVSEAQGGWTDDNGILTRENTLVYLFTGATVPQITAIMDEVLTSLNQSSILVSTNAVQSTYYSGSDNAR